MLLDSGTLTFTIPYYLDLSGNTKTVNQGYLNDLDYSVYTGNTQFSGITYYSAFAQSKISELKKYGTNEYSGVTVNGNISGYTIEGVYYEDHPEGYTIITGNTVNFKKEEVFMEVLTRNEHFLGFVDQPTIYSDVFIERGKQGVMEMNLRLGEVGSIGEINNYGNGYFKIKKQ